MSQIFVSCLVLSQAKLSLSSAGALSKLQDLAYKEFPFPSLPMLCCPSALTRHPSSQSLLSSPGSSSAPTHRFRWRGKKERKRKGNKAELYVKSSVGALELLSSVLWCLPPCAEGALSRDSVSLPGPSHQAGLQQRATQIPDGTLPLEGLPRLFGLLLTNCSLNS